MVLTDYMNYIYKPSKTMPLINICREFMIIDKPYYYNVLEGPEMY